MNNNCLNTLALILIFLTGANRTYTMQYKNDTTLLKRRQCIIHFSYPEPRTTFKVLFRKVGDSEQYMCPQVENYPQKLVSYNAISDEYMTRYDLFIKGKTTEQIRQLRDATDLDPAVVFNQLKERYRQQEAFAQKQRNLKIKALKHSLKKRRLFETLDASEEVLIP